MLSHRRLNFQKPLCPLLSHLSLLSSPLSLSLLSDFNLSSFFSFLLPLPLLPPPPPPLLPLSNGLAMLVSSPTPSALLARCAIAAGLQRLPFLLTWILSPMNSPTSPSIPSSSPSSAMEASIEDWCLVDPNPFLKPWPSLPSFLPWSFSPLPPARSCEAYFGHGFSRRINALYSSSSSFSSSSTGGKGWFQCYYSETLASSISEGGKPSPSPAHPHHRPISGRPLCAGYLPLLFPRNPNPSLPSFLPWSFSPPPPTRSCEDYFGHDFSHRIDALCSSSSSSTGGGKWVRCYYTKTLASSICEGGRVRMDSGRISMADGGEALEAVMGHGEEEDFLKYELEAFEIEAGEEGIGRADRRVVDEKFLISM